MLDILNFIFSGFWVCVGSFILIYMVLDTINTIISNILRTIMYLADKKRNKNDDQKEA